MSARPRTRTPRTRTPADDDATPAERIAAEVSAACAALRRALAAGKDVRDDIELELVLDDLAVVASDLDLINRDIGKEGAR